MLFRVIPLLLLLLCMAPHGYAGGPDYRLLDGTAVSIDPATRHATTLRNGISAPLNDGTHRTLDGMTLIVNRGVTTVTGSATGIEAPDRPATDVSACQQLVARTCGKRQECADSEGCNLATQLLDMETQERTDGASFTYSSGQCQIAAGNLQLFPPCAQPLQHRQDPDTSVTK